MFQRISFYLFRNNKFEEKGVGGLKLFKDNGEQETKLAKKLAHFSAHLLKDFILINLFEDISI